MIFNMTGGGASLNFQVKTYPSETELKADNPKENTIGVITTTTMSSWVFSATEPTEPEVGMVWIVVGTSGAADFNAIKKNTLQVYPLFAKQYVSGAWVKIEARSYQNGAWVDWIHDALFVKDGTFYQEYEIKGSLSVSGNTVSYAAGVKDNYFMYWKRDVTNYSSLKYKVDTTAVGSYNGVRVGLIKDLTRIDDMVAWVGVQENPQMKEDSTPISSYSGEFYVVLAVQSGSGGTAGSFKLYHLELL